MNYLDQLRSIQNATGWPQERLARELGVSFPALNAWLNERSVPRRGAVARIDALHGAVVGVESINPDELSAARTDAMRLTYSVKKLLGDKRALDMLTLHWTYHTNTIEGSTMTLSDVEGVIFDHRVLSNRTLIEQTEARNHQAALYWLLDKISADGKDFVIDEELILGLHVRLMNGLIANAGQYRKHSVRILGTHVPLANWQRVPDLIHELVMGAARSADGDIVTRLARTHAAFEKVHPFSDGNGRTGRLLMLAQALAADVMPPLVVRERKRAYYRYLEAAQTKEDYASLELFVAQSMRACYELLAEYPD